MCCVSKLPVVGVGDEAQNTHNSTVIEREWFV